MLKSLFHKLFDEISQTEFLINVGNVFVNSILNAKLNMLLNPKILK